MLKGHAGAADSFEPSAIICATDTIAFGALKTLLRFGKKVPEDVSLAGFGGYNISEVIHPSMTTISFNNEATGVMAANTIVKMTDGEEVPPLQVSSFTFIEGESVKSKKMKTFSNKGLSNSKSCIRMSLWNRFPLRRFFLDGNAIFFYTQLEPVPI